MSKPKLFIRQSFTETDDKDAALIQQIIDIVAATDKVEIITGTKALNRNTFRREFEETYGMAYTSRNFRSKRLSMINEADGMLIVRTALSESGAFEIAYNIYGGRNIPMFFAYPNTMRIKATLLRDLSDIAAAEYQAFKEPIDLEAALNAFLDKLDTGEQTDA